MNESLYDIECYDENEFITKHEKMYKAIQGVASRVGVDLTKYEFGQYLQTKHETYGANDDITYNSLHSEDITFNVQFLDNKLESVGVDMD